MSVHLQPGILGTDDSRCWRRTATYPSQVTQRDQPHRSYPVLPHAQSSQLRPRDFPQNESRRRRPNSLTIIPPEPTSRRPEMRYPSRRACRLAIRQIKVQNSYQTIRQSSVHPKRAQENRPEASQAVSPSSPQPSFIIRKFSLQSSLTQHAILDIKPSP